MDTFILSTSFMMHNTQRVVEEIGLWHIVQVVTYNRENFKKSVEQFLDLIETFILESHMQPTTSTQ